MDRQLICKGVCYVVKSTSGCTTALEHVRHELAGVRSGRASVTILDSVHVDAYGSRMPLNQLAGLSVPEPSLIVAQPFDPSLLGAIEKAIRASDLGLNPSNDGKVIRIPIPALTESAARNCRATSTSWPRKAGTASARSAATPTIAEEAPEGPQDLRGRREEGARRGPEDHRQPHQADRRAAEEEGLRSLLGR